MQRLQKGKRTTRHKGHQKVPATPRGKGAIPRSAGLVDTDVVKNSKAKRSNKPAQTFQKIPQKTPRAHQRRLYKNKRKVLRQETSGKGASTTTGK